MKHAIIRAELVTWFLAVLPTTHCALFRWVRRGAGVRSSCSAGICAEMEARDVEKPLTPAMIGLEDKGPPPSCSFLWHHGSSCQQVQAPGLTDSSCFWEIKSTGTGPKWKLGVAPIDLCTWSVFLDSRYPDASLTARGNTSWTNWNAAGVLYLGVKRLTISCWR